ncbi:DUF3667 domain-containing protein [Rhodocytophaga rosea]|uniref:DUF3667 domain-containing protein n=1 Tax=Rhodocytophaga rosea TaxID=2704465 RepID=A0A6C0GN27_9BACT|nr:DUF3667 domain-containing protein [Rhodocytophaga rosea]QHT69337.1 DUF3667 domain-containing protein [Rhodocytophaga rosea]
MIETLTTATCKNCTAEVEMNYCPVCGQKRTEQRVTFRKIYKEFLHDYLGFDSGIFYTTRNLLLRPGHTVNEYLAGRRKPYLKPLQYYLILLTLYFVISSLFNIDLMKLGQSMTQDAGLTSSYSPQMQEKMQKFNYIFDGNLKVITTLMLPLTALALLMVYRRKNYNFTELLVFTLYIYGLTMAFYCLQNLLLAFPLSPLPSKLLFYTLLLMGYVYIVFAIVQFFSTKGLLGILRAIWALVLSYLIYIILVTVLWTVLFMM